MTETFGAMGGDIGVEGLYAELMEQFSKGINYIVPHAVWYDNRNDIVFPPELSYRSEKYGKELKQINYYSARVSRLLQGGCHKADIGVLYPIYSLQSAYFMDWGNPYAGGPVRPEFDYQEIGRLLSDEIRKDYTFIHPEVLNEKCNVKSKCLILNNDINTEAYKVIIIPGGAVIDKNNLSKLMEFWTNGGYLIFTSMLPKMSSCGKADQEVQNMINRIFNNAHNINGVLCSSVGNAYFIANYALLPQVLN